MRKLRVLRNPMVYMEVDRKKISEEMIGSWNSQKFFEFKNWIIINWSKRKEMTLPRSLKEKIRRILEAMAALRELV